MRQVMLVGLLAIGLTAPAAAYSQPMVPVPMQATTADFTIQPVCRLVIGAGVIAGSLVPNVILPANVARSARPRRPILR
jgi:hypothetical protein